VDYLRRTTDAVFGQTRQLAWKNKDSRVGVRSEIDAGSVERLEKRGVEPPLEDPKRRLKGSWVIESDTPQWCALAWVHHTTSPLGEIVAALTESRAVTYYNDQMFLKEAGSNFKTPFHQDKPFFMLRAVEPAREHAVAVCWVPVDPATRETGAMRYVRGSHRWGKIFAPSDFVGGVIPGHETVDRVPSELEEEEHPKNFEVLTLEAEPGDVIVHDWRTLHGAWGNLSSGSSSSTSGIVTSGHRCAASVRYIGDGVVWEEKENTGPHAGSVHRQIALHAGQFLHEEPSGRFPKVWPRPGVELQTGKTGAADTSKL